MYRWESKPSGIAAVAEQPMAAIMIIKQNTRPGEESVTLPDNSHVLLAPGSTIRYQEGFTARARNIQLEGRALFDVTKDPRKPFTVTAHGFATTALGTRFIVDATRPLISIRLLKGRIVVNATADAGIALQKMYLSPGQELRINTTTKHVDMLMPNSQPPHTGSTDGNKTSTLSFEKTSLATVFQRLSEYYKTPIRFDKAGVRNLSFTGDFKPSDDLELTLKVICNMNQLSFTKESDHIVIKKQL